MYVYQELLRLLDLEGIFILSITHDPEFDVVTVRMFLANLIIFRWQFLNFSKNYILICFKFLNGILLKERVNILQGNYEWKESFFPSGFINEVITQCFI